MKDVSGKIWDYSKDELFVADWLEENGFDFTIRKRFVSKTIFEVRKNDVQDELQLPQGLKSFDVESFVKQFDKSFELLCNLVELRKEASPIK